MATRGKGGPTLALIGREPDAAFYAAEASKRGGPVLVLGCADGRIAWELASEGIPVTGVDPSAVMVEAAEARKAGAPPEVQDRLRFVVADLRSLRTALRYPLVLAPQNALGLMTSLDDLEALLATVHHHLSPGGTFVFDVVTPPPKLGLPPPSEEGPEEPNAPLEPARPVFAPHLRERRRAEGKASAGIRRLKLRHFSPEEVDTALREAGFLALERFGGFHAQPFEPGATLQVVHAVLDTRPALQ